MTPSHLLNKTNIEQVNPKSPAQKQKEKMEYGKTKLIRMLSNIPREGWSNAKIKDLIDSLWRDPFTLRWSGFEVAGGTDTIMEWSDETTTLRIYPEDLYSSASDADPVPNYAFYQYVTKLTFHVKNVEDTADLSGDPDLADSAYDSAAADGIMEEGFYMVFFDTDPDDGEQRLTWIYNPTEEQEHQHYLTKVLVAWIYWDATSATAVYFGDERHGSEWNPQINWWSHNVFNAVLKDGLEATDYNLGDGSVDKHAQLGFTEGSFWHEDITHNIDETVYTDGCPVMYFNSANVLPRIAGEAGFSISISPAGRAMYNELDTGSVAEAESGSFVLYHYFATNCVNYPVISFMGGAAYDEKNEAVLGAKAEMKAILEIMPQKTRLPLYTIIYETSDEFTNSVKSRIVAASNNHIGIGWQDGSYDEIIAEIIAEETVPYLKTGWHPGVQNEAAWDFTDGAMKLTIAPADERVRVWIQGKKFTFESSIFRLLNPGSGMHYLMIEKDGEESKWYETTTQWDNSQSQRAFVAAIYVNETQAKAIYVGYEAHAYNMEPETRGNMHREVFTEYISGLAVSEGASPHMLNVSSGEIHDEDIEALIQHATGGNVPEFGMELSPLKTHRLYLQYDEASGQDLWFEDIENDYYIVKLDENNDVQYLAPPGDESSASAGSGYTLASTETGEFAAIWLLATMDYRYPVKIILGTGKGADLAEAKENNPVTDLKALIDAAPFCCEEYVLLGRVIVSNTDQEPYYNVEEIEDFRDTDLDDMDDDIYVESAEFDHTTRTVTLHRTRNMPDIEVDLPVYAQKSIDGDGSDVYALELLNDEENPGVLHVYGTDANGVKGWFPLVVIPSDSSASSGSSSDSSGSSGESSSGQESPTPLIDNYVTSGEWDSTNEVLVLHRNNNLPDIEITIPNTQTDDKKEWQSFEYRNIEADTAYTFTVDIMADRAYTINSAVFQAGNTISGIAVNISGSPVGGLGSISATTSATRTTATGSNTVSVGNSVTITVAESHGDGTILKGKISITYS